MDRNIRKLPDAELEVMQAVWTCGIPAVRGDIEAVVNRTRPMATTTVLTVLGRLAGKGFLKIEKAGRGLLYTPLVTREEYLAEQSRSFFQKLCGSSLPTFAAALCDSGLTKEELAELRALLERNEL